MTQPINRYKGTLPYLLMNVEGALLQVGVRIDKTTSPTQPKTEQQFLRWKCCSECKPLTKAEVSAIVDLKDMFDKPMIELRQDLDMCDSGCPNQHYTRVETRSFEH